MWDYLFLLYRHLIAALERLPRTEVAMLRLCFPAEFLSQQFCHKYVEALYNT